MPPGPVQADSQREPAIERLLGRLPEFRDAAAQIKEMLLANLVMIGEIPSPTFDEQRRLRFLQDRFAECGLVNCSTDELNNALGIMPGAEEERHILVVAHGDTAFARTEDHTISVNEDHAIGPAVADNALGLAAVATLPTLLDRLGIALRSNLVLMGSSRSLGRGDLEGLRFFLENSPLKIDYGVCVEGAQLGRLSYNAIGMLRGEIIVEVPEEYDISRFGASHVIRILNRIISRIEQIPLPAEPKTTILIGSINSGSTYNIIPNRAEMRFEVRSESADMVRRLHDHIQQIVDEMVVTTRANVVFHVVTQREPGGIAFAHPLVQITRRVMDNLNIEPQVSPSLSELVAFIRNQIPAVTLGISNGRNLGKTNEAIMIEPMYTGLTQLLAVLIAIDEGLCDVD